MSRGLQSRASARSRLAGFARARASAVLRPAGNFLSGGKKSPKNTFKRSLPRRNCFGKRGESPAPQSESLQIAAGLLADNLAKNRYQRHFCLTALCRGQWVSCRVGLRNAVQCGALRGISAHRCSSSVAVFFKGVPLVTFFAQALRRRSGANSVAGRVAAMGRMPGVKKVTRSSAGRVEAPFFQSAFAAP
jgi:hypothetical protein